MNVGVDFPWILATITIAMGCIALVEVLVLAKHSKPGRKRPMLADWSISFFPIFLPILTIILLNLAAALLYRHKTVKSAFNRHIV